MKTEERLNTIVEAVEKTRMSSSWWRQQIYQKKIRYLKIGRRVFIPDSTIEELIRRSIIEPTK